MARTTSSTMTAQPRRSARNLKREHTEDNSSPLPNTSQPRSKKIKKEEPDSPAPKTPSRRKPTTASSPLSPPPSSSKKNAKSPADKAAALQSRKLASYSFSKSPYPSFPHPTPSECRLAHSILASLHGDRSRPTTVVAPKDKAGCGNSPSVLDALVRTILSQNTSDKNSSRAKRSMDDVYGSTDDSSPSAMEAKWAAIVSGGQSKLQKAIQSGGLSVVKSKVIIDILTQVKEKHGTYSLDHLFREPDDAECMREMLSFRGIGPKTASCVLLFCLKRESFAVDTHVHRITGLLGWRPEAADRDQAHAHLDARIPDEEKYPLHVLLITHGKSCEECRAGGRNAGKCELRKAFRKGKVKAEDGVKEEEVNGVKEDVDDVKKEEDVDVDVVKKEEEA